jgi:hypothetical protein
VSAISSDYTDEDRTFQLLGQAYIEDIMYGQAVSWIPEDAQDFVLI